MGVLLVLGAIALGGVVAPLLLPAPGAAGTGVGVEGTLLGQLLGADAGVAARAHRLNAAPPHGCLEHIPIAWNRRL